MKRKLLISFSGGETSAYMTQWLWNHMHHEYHIKIVFANTGQENEETLAFVEQCSQYFGFPVTWVEAVPRVKFMGQILEMCSEVFGLKWKGARLGTTYRKVNFTTACRDGEVFEKVIQKYGIPNQNAPICTRELKQRPIHAYAKALGWKDYYTAIGIREDEMDRVNDEWKENKFLYPLIVKEMQPMTKQKINFWWSQQPFRLELKGYEGNCKWCHKKYINKLYKIAQEHPEAFDFPERMERLYENYVSESIVVTLKKKGKPKLELPIRFFRGNKSVADIKREALDFNGEVNDDTQEFESCEVFSGCSTV
jgi:hypothetical protein